MGYIGRSALRTIYTLFVVLFFVWSFIHISNKEEAERKNTMNMTETRAYMASSGISYYFESYINSLSVMGKLSVTEKAISGDPAAAKEFSDIVNMGGLEREYAENIILLDKNKRVAASSSENYRDFSESLDKLIDRASTGAVISDLYLSRQPGSLQKVFAIIVPVYENKKLMGYILSEINSDVFSAAASDFIESDENFGLWITDSSGEVASEIGSESIIKLFSQKTGEYEEGGIRSDHYYIYKKKIDLSGLRTDWSVIYIFYDGASGTYLNFKIDIGIICIIMLLLEVTVSLLYHHRIVAPYRSIMGDLKNIYKTKDFTLSVNKTGGRNFDKLVDLINNILRGVVDGDSSLAALTEKYKELFNNKKLVFIEWDLTSLNMTASPNYKEVFGREFTPFGESGGSTVMPNIHPDDILHFTEWLKDVRMGRKTPPIIYRKMLNGKYRYFEFSFFVKNDDMGNPSSGVGLIIDVDRFKRKEIALRRAADIDRYTGIYNKYAFHGILAERLEAAKKNGENYTVAIIKLHNYYRLEDESVGLGEEAVRFVANVITDNIDCCAGRILTDAVGIVGSSKNIEFLCQEINKELNMGFLYNKNSKMYHTHSSFAVLFTDEIGTDFDTVISKCVDEYESFKETDKNDYYFV